MAKPSKQLLFALLSALILMQSMTVFANTCLNSQEPAAEQLQPSCLQTCCGETSDQAHSPQSESCSDGSDCNGYCHPHCLCHDLCVTVGITPPVADVATTNLSSTPYFFTLYAYNPPEPKDLLRPPCT